MSGFFASTSTLGMKKLFSRPVFVHVLPASVDFQTPLPCVLDRACIGSPVPR
jgi:hypothetical protein